MHVALFCSFASFCRPACERCIKHVGNHGKALVKNRSQLCAFSRAKSEHSHAAFNLMLVQRYSMLHVCRPRQLVNPNRFFFYGETKRHFIAGRTAKMLGRFLKIRYLVITSAVGGGITMQRVSINQNVCR